MSLDSSSLSPLTTIPRFLKNPGEFWLYGPFLTHFPGWNEAFCLHIVNGRLCCFGEHFPHKSSNIYQVRNGILIPPLGDSHVHLYELGFSMIDGDLSFAKDTEHITEILKVFEKNSLAKERAKAKGKNGEIYGAKGWENSVIIARNLDESLFLFPEKKNAESKINRLVLDRAFPRQKVILVAKDQHSFLLNSQALNWLNITEKSPFIDKENGIISGTCGNIIWEKLYELRDANSFEKALDIVVKHAMKKGLGIIRGLFGLPKCDDICKAQLEILEKYANRRDGQIYILKDSANKMELKIDPWLQTTNTDIPIKAGLSHIGGCLMLDGSIGSKTAALNEPYFPESLKNRELSHCHDKKQREYEEYCHYKEKHKIIEKLSHGKEGHKEYGKLYFSDAELENFIAKASALNLTTAFHAIGDRAIEQALCAFDKRGLGLSHRLEHIELASNKQIEKIKSLGLLPSVQPAFEYFWGGPNGLYEKRLGNGWKKTNSFRTMLDFGLEIAGGSDAPITPLDPLFGIYCAMNHPNKEQRLGFDEAAALFSRWAYKACDIDGGFIAPGQAVELSIIGFPQKQDNKSSQAENIYEINDCSADISKTLLNKIENIIIKLESFDQKTHRKIMEESSKTMRFFKDNLNRSDFLKNCDCQRIL